MPRRKGKKTTNQQTPQEPEDPQAEAFERLSDKRTATFTQGFDKLQQAIVTMAQQTTAQTKEANQQKRPAEEDIPGYNTRNKGLRPVYNPQMDLTQNKPKKKAPKASAAAGKPTDAIDVQQDDANLPRSSAPAPPVRHCLSASDVNIPRQPGPSDNALDMNDWIIGQVNTQKPSASAFILLMSVADMPKDTSLEAQVQQVLLNTASSLAKGNQTNGLFPHKYVVRGPEKKKLGLLSLY